MMENKPVLFVAEDDQDDQYFFQEALAVACPESVEPYFAFDGAQLMSALQAKAKISPWRNLIVLDLNMKVKDGRITLDEIKSNPSYADIPVVILTTSENEEDARYCLQHGAAAYFRKPNRIVDLVEIMRILFKNYLN
jgi:CheY-like chemotaxis protein